jgi:DNA-binding transcriptional MerR regulator
MAKLCDVSVRTVQYYDDRGILIPSELSEGGRRLYTDADLRKLKIICFLHYTTKQNKCQSQTEKLLFLQCNTAEIAINIAFILIIIR